MEEDEATEEEAEEEAEEAKEEAQEAEEEPVEAEFCFAILGGETSSTPESSLDES